jgi:hypothetical protein
MDRMTNTSLVPDARNSAVIKSICIRETFVKTRTYYKPKRMKRFPQIGPAILDGATDGGKSITAPRSASPPCTRSTPRIGIAFTSIRLRITNLAHSAKSSIITSSLGRMSRRYLSRPQVPRAERHVIARSKEHATGSTPFCSMLPVPCSLLSAASAQRAFS